MNVKNNIPELKNVLLIAGSGQNVGKTTMGCRIVTECSNFGHVVAVKISPHFHPLSRGLKVLHESDELIITEETDRFTRKDSSRYLRAGASRVLYVQTQDDGLPRMVKWIMEFLDTDIPIVIESGGLGNYLNPGVGLYLRHKASEKNCEWKFNHKQIEVSDEPNELKACLVWKNPKWQNI